MKDGSFCAAEIASMVANGLCSSSTQMPPLVSAQEKGSRNKRKFRADSPLGDGDTIMSASQNECPCYEFSEESFDVMLGAHLEHNACDFCSVNQGHSDGLKLGLGFSSATASLDVGSSLPREKLEGDEFQDADWNDLIESELEELVLSNLHAIFKSAIRNIVACGYTEEVATEAVLRSGILYGCKDTVSNIVDNTLAFLRSGQEIVPLRDYRFENLQQLEKHILTELVCFLRETRPFFSIGDAMWCLMLCDMNVSHVCAMDSNFMGSFIDDGASNASSYTTTPPEMKCEVKNSEVSPRTTCKAFASSTYCHNAESEATLALGKSDTTKPKNFPVLNGLVLEKESASITSDALDKPFGVSKTSQFPASKEKSTSSRKMLSSSAKREILWKKSLHLEKSYRVHGCKSSSEAGKLSGFGGITLDKKLNSVTDLSVINLKNAPIKMSKAMGVDVNQGHRSQSPSFRAVPSSAAAPNLETANTPSALPRTHITSSSSTIYYPPTSPASSPLDTELSLSPPTKNNSTSVSASCNTDAANLSSVEIPHDMSLGRWIPQDKKDEAILKLVPRMQELQNQLQEWTEWANQKVMQAARRLGKDKSELKTLRQEKEEVERLKKEKQALEENTMKKLAEMDNALAKASGQVERANAAVRRLELENLVLRKEMEAAKFRAAESAASSQEVTRREKKTLTKFRSGEKQISMLQEELATERRKMARYVRELEQAKIAQEKIEVRWKQEEKATEDLLMQASSIRKDREHIEAVSNSKEDMIKLKAEKNLRRYKEDIQRLEKEISQLRLKTDSTRIAALRQGIDGSHASRLLDSKNGKSHKDFKTRFCSIATESQDASESNAVKRERECVMCLSEEMSVLFLPCAHQVVCNSCNELHKKQGMKDCPSCRGPIKRRIPVLYVHA